MNIEVSQTGRKKVITLNIPMSFTRREVTSNAWNQTKSQLVRTIAKEYRSLLNQVEQNVRSKRRLTRSIA